MAERLVQANTPPKIVRVYHDAGQKRAFVGTVWLKDVPGALAAAAAGIAGVGVNLVSSSSSNLNGTGLAEWGFFAEVDDRNLTLERICEVIRKIPQVSRFELQEGYGGLVVDSIHYPLKFSTGQQGMIVSRGTFSGMLTHMREVYGTGGSVIAYQLGFSTGKKDANELLRVIGTERVLQNIASLTNVYLAQGWGVPELVKLSIEPLDADIRITDSFECANLRSSRPNSHFLRGHLAGLANVLFEKNVECTEVKCAAMGNDYCEFHCIEV
jgi:predicted hydrocarbon binding protein